MIVRASSSGRCSPFSLRTPRARAKTFWTPAHMYEVDVSSVWAYLRSVSPSLRASVVKRRHPRQVQLARLDDAYVYLRRKLPREGSKLQRRRVEKRAPPATERQQRQGEEHPPVDGHGQRRADQRQRLRRAPWIEVP